MSWQEYVDSQLVASGQVSQGALLGTDGSLWASTPDFMVQFGTCNLEKDLIN